MAPYVSAYNKTTIKAQIVAKKGLVQSDNPTWIFQSWRFSPKPAAARKQNLLGLMIGHPQGHYYLINSPLERNTQPRGNQVTDIDFPPVNKVSRDRNVQYWELERDRETERWGGSLRPPMRGPLKWIWKVHPTKMPLSPLLFCVEHLAHRSILDYKNK